MTRWSKAFYIFAIPTTVFAGIGYASGVNISLYTSETYKKFSKCIDSNNNGKTPPF